MEEGIDPAVVAEFAWVGRFAASRGWVPATAGNFSRRLDQRFAVVTRSGADKGEIGERDLMVAEIAQPAPPGSSAEAPLHLALYRTRPEIGAVLHVHSVAATVLSRRFVDEGEIVLQGYEMQKVLGMETHDAQIRVPIFENAQDTQALAQRVSARLPAAGPPCYLLAGHGVYAWGSDVRQAAQHLEGIEFLLACELEERRRA